MIPAQPALAEMAPLSAALVVAAAALALEVVAAEVVAPVAVVLEAPAGVEVCEARGAVDWPAIWDWTAGVNSPVMLSRLHDGTLLGRMVG